jgi:hypothetical protein
LKGALLDRNPAGRAIVLRKAREQTLTKSRGNYPALIAAIDVIATGYEKGPAEGYREESRRFGEMAMTDVSRQLIFLFFATNELKKDPGVDPLQYSELPVSAFEPLPIDKIAIIGAGFMGAGIASIAVQHGSLVRLKDADHSRVAKGYAAVRDVLKERLTRKQITKVQYSDYMALVGGTVDYSGFGNVDLVRGSRRQASGFARDRSCDQTGSDLCHQYIDHSNCVDRAGIEQTGSSARHAFLLAGSQDAAARGDHHRAGLSAGAGDGGRIRQEARQDRHRRE